MDDNEHQAVDAVDGRQEQTEPRGRGRGGSLPGIAAALARPAGAGLAHWGGPAPATRREPAVDVAGGALPGPGALPRT